MCNDTSTNSESDMNFRSVAMQKPLMLSPAPVKALNSKGIQSLSPQCQRLLKTAAFLGKNVERTVLRQLIEEDDRMLEDTLQQVTEKGFLQKPSDLDDNLYIFRDEQTQHEAYALVPVSEQAMFHLTIGRTLYQNLTTNTRRSSSPDRLFLVVDQMIHGIPLLKEETDKYGLANLCLQAGKQSAKHFGKAIHYFETGITLLAQRCWRDEYHLCLDLYSSLAEATCSTADFRRMDQAIDLVLTHVRPRSPSDTVRAYTTRIYALSARLRPKEALALGKTVVKQLGVKLPARPGIISFLRGFFKVKGKLGKFQTDDDILALPDMDPHDRNQIAAMTILSIMATNTYTADESDLYPNICFAMIAISLQQGLTAMSSHGFCLLSVVFCAMDDYESSYRYSLLALKIMNRYPQVRTEWLPRVQATINGLSYVWRGPLTDTFAPLLEAHAVGRESGDIEFSVLAGHFHSLNSYVSGRQLQDIEKSHAAFYNQMVELKHETWLAMAAVLLQFLRNLIGMKTDNPQVLQVDTDDESKKASYQAQSVFKTICQMVLSYHYDALDPALDCANKSRGAERTLKPSPFLFVFYLYNGMIQFQAARNAKVGKRRKCLSRGKAMTKKLETLAKSCPENFLSSSFLLKAELLDLQNKKEESFEYYSKAIEHAKKQGFLHVVAMANESYGLACQRRGEPSRDLLKSAIAGYRDWGALAIVSHKQAQYAKL